MIKSIKKLFSVDESELDFDEIDEIEEVEDKSKYYQEELSQNNLDTTSKIGYNTRNNIVDEGNKFREIDVKVSYEHTTKNDEKIAEIKEYKQQTDPFMSDELDSISDKSARRSFDFEKAIESSYEQEPKEEVEKVQFESEDNNKRDLNTKSSEEIVNKDNYVLKDIISPMRGVVRKEKNTIKKDGEHKKAQIIKLREQVKTTEIDQSDEYSQTIEFPFETNDTIDLESTLTSLTKESPKETLSETSRFTLIEDSTGEMRLVIDEEE